MSRRNNKNNKTKKNKSEADDDEQVNTKPKFKKIWYIITAIVFFILVLMSMISASYTLFFLSQNPSCTGVSDKTMKATKNANIALIIFAVICLVSVIGFAALQVRKQRMGRIKEKAKEEARSDSDSDSDEEEDDKPVKKSKKKKKQNEREEEEEENENEMMISPPNHQTENEIESAVSKNTSPSSTTSHLDPVQLTKIIQDLPISGVSVS